jgi:hypothetical protein
MTDRHSLADLERRLIHAERELAAWQKSKHGSHHAEIGAKLVAALKAEIAALRSTDTP